MRNALARFCLALVPLLSVGPTDAFGITLKVTRCVGEERPPNCKGKASAAELDSVYQVEVATESVGETPFLGLSFAKSPKETLELEVHAVTYKDPAMTCITSTGDSCWGAPPLSTPRASLGGQNESQIATRVVFSVKTPTRSTGIPVFTPIELYDEDDNVIAGITEDCDVPTILDPVGAAPPAPSISSTGTLLLSLLMMCGIGFLAMRRHSPGARARLSSTRRTRARNPGSSASGASHSSLARSRGS